MSFENKETEEFKYTISSSDEEYEDDDDDEDDYYNEDEAIKLEKELDKKFKNISDEIEIKSDLIINCIDYYMENKEINDEIIKMIKIDTFNDAVYSLACELFGLSTFNIKRENDKINIVVYPK